MKRGDDVAQSIPTKKHYVAHSRICRIVDKPACYYYDRVLVKNAKTQVSGIKKVQGLETCF